MNAPLQVPSSFTAVTELGEPRKIYRISTGTKISTVFSVVIYLVMAVGIFFVVRPMLSGVQGAGLGSYPTIITFAVPGFLVFFAALQLVKFLVDMNKAIVVYDKGIAFQSRGLQQWKWEDFVSIQAQVTRYTYYGVIPAGTTQNYSLINMNGHYLGLNQTIAKVEELVADIRQGTKPILVDRAWNMYQMGQPVTFGPIMINKEGITLNRKFYNWADVQSVTVNNGQVVIAKKGGGFFSGASTPAATVYNLEIFLLILQKIGGDLSIK